MKKPRLFYWEEEYDAWVPAPEKIENIVDADHNFGEDGEIIEIRFKRIDMTDEEIGALPEC